MSNTNMIKSLSDHLKENGKLMPVLFIGHGSPMNAIEDNEFSDRWKELGKEMHRKVLIIKKDRNQILTKINKRIIYTI